MKLQDEHRDLTEKNKELAEDTKFYAGERRKLEVHVDAGGPTLDQIRRKLQEVDPSRFREVMKDLNYMGDEPEWEKRELIDRVSGADAAAADGEAGVRLQRKEIERLMVDRRELATKLQRTQDLLKQQVDIDKENTDLIDAEIKHYKMQIQNEKERAQQLQNQFASRAA